MIQATSAVKLNRMRTIYLPGSVSSVRFGNKRHDTLEFQPTQVPPRRRLRRLVYAAMLLASMVPVNKVLVETSTRLPGTAITLRELETPWPKNPVFVIHSGLGDQNNWGGSQIRNNLLAMGVREENIIVLDSPYPQLGGLARLSSLQLVGTIVKSMSQEVSNTVMRQSQVDTLIRTLNSNLDIFYQSANPDSAVARQQYQQMKEALAARGHNNAEVVWIGHSAGGQMGITMATENRRDPDSDFTINSVVMLGSPIIKNKAPHDVQIISVISKDDAFMDRTVTYDFIVGFNLKKVPPNLDDNDHVVTVSGLNHLEIAHNLDLLKQLFRNLELDNKPEQMAEIPEPMRE